jgi:hypothetical protein
MNSLLLSSSSVRIQVNVRLGENSESPAGKAKKVLSEHRHSVFRPANLRSVASNALLLERIFARTIFFQQAVAIHCECCARDLGICPAQVSPDSWLYSGVAPVHDHEFPKSSNNDKFNALFRTSSYCACCWCLLRTVPPSRTLRGCTLCTLAAKQRDKADVEGKRCMYNECGGNRYSSIRSAGILKCHFIHKIQKFKKFDDSFFSKAY